MTIDFDKYRRIPEAFKAKGTIDLCEAAYDQGIHLHVSGSHAMKFLRRVEETYPITSRQAAAIVLAMADTIARGEL